MKGRAPLVDFSNRFDLRARPKADCSNPAHRTGSRPPTQLFSRVATLVPDRRGFLSVAGRWSAASRDFTGQGPEARWRVAPHCLVRLPLRSLATGALPQPDRPGHLVSRARGAAGWSLPLRRGSVSGALFTSLPDARRFRGMRRLGPPHTLLREEPRAPLHPRCLPSPDNPVRGCAPLVHSLSPACGVRGAGAFSIFVRPTPLTRRQARSRTRSRASRAALEPNSTARSQHLRQLLRSEPSEIGRAHV